MNFIHGYKESASHHRENGNDFCRAQYFAAIDNVTETIRPQFVDTLFIVRLRLNMSMRRAVIINYFLVQKVELKIYYYRLLKFCLGMTKSPWHNLKVKRAQN